MRIIRLSTEQPDGIFDNNFQSDIIVKPFSKIALANIAFEIIEDTIIIETGNDEIKFMITGSSESDLKTVQLAHGTYTKNNLDTILTSITNGINALLTSSTASEIGYECLVRKETNNKIRFNFRQGKLKDFPDNWFNYGIDSSISSQGQNQLVYFSDIVPGSTGDTHQINLGKYMSKGCGIFRCKIHKLIDNGSGDTNDNGFIMGLSNSNPQLLPNRIVTGAQATYSIICGRPTDNYRFRVNNVVTNTAIPINYVGNDSSQNDVLQIEVSGKEIIFKIFSNRAGAPADGDVLHTIEYNQTETLYPFIIFRGGKDDAKVTQVRFTESQFQPNPYTLTETEVDVEYHDLLGSPPRQRVRPTNSLLVIEGDSLSNYLGFDNSRNPTTGFNVTTNATFTADNVFVDPYTNELFIIELLNMKLNSYDGYSEERRSIIATIPKKNENTVVQYEPNEKVFVDIGNHDALTIRNLQAVIRQNDLSFQPTKGLSSMTLLIKDSDE